jgi:hypothetical protein
MPRERHFRKDTSMFDVRHAHPDFSLGDKGTIAVLFPPTPAAERWVDNNLQPDALTWCGGTVIEHRIVAPLVAGILDGGLEVRA